MRQYEEPGEDGSFYGYPRNAGVPPPIAPEDKARAIIEE